MPVKKKGTIRTKSAKTRTSSAKHSAKKITAAAARRPKRSRKTPRRSAAKIHQGVGLERGASQTGGLTRAAEKIGAAIGATVGMMDTAVHSAAAFGAREVATATHEVGLLAKKFHARAPNRPRTRSGQ